VAGKVEVEGEPLDEGQVVTVLALDADATFELGVAEEAALLAAIEEAERGEVVSGDEVIRQLRHG